MERDFNMRKKSNKSVLIFLYILIGILPSCIFLVVDIIFIYQNGGFLLTVRDKNYLEMFLLYFFAFIGFLYVPYRILFVKEKVKSKYDKTFTPIGIIDENTKKKLDTNHDGKIQIDEIYPIPEEEIIASILTYDENFSKEQFSAWLNHLFIHYLDAWNHNDLSLLKKFEANSLYMIDSLKIKNNIENQLVKKYEDVFIRGSLIKDFKIVDDQEILVVSIACKMKSYLFDVRNNKIKEGTDKDDNYSYLLTFQRNKNVKSNYSADTTRTCLNCGASIQLNDEGICDYCGSSITSSEYDWGLIEVKSVDISKNMGYVK